MNLQKAFAENLKNYRKRSGFTQKALASKLNYSDKAVGKWESGKCIPPAEALVKISKLLSVSVDDLLSVSSEPEYYLGINGSALKTEFMLTDKSGRLLLEIAKGPSNPSACGINEAKRILKEGINEVCSGVPLSGVAMFAGLSGCTTSDNQAVFNSFFNTFSFASYGCGGDVENIIAIGLGKNDGVALIIGTGIIAYAVKDGVKKGIAGWGYLFDMGGSAYSFGRDAIYAALCSEDGTGKQTKLLSELTELFGKKPSEALSDIYAGGMNKIAAAADAVFRAYEGGDSVAAEIIYKNCQEISRIIETSCKTIGNRKTEVVIAGSMTKYGNIIFPLIEKDLQGQGITIRTLSERPVLGALLRAREEVKNSAKR